MTVDIGVGLVISVIFVAVCWTLVRLAQTSLLRGAMKEQEKKDGG